MLLDIRDVTGRRNGIREEYTFNNAAKTPKMLTFVPHP